MDINAYIGSRTLRVLALGILLLQTQQTVAATHTYPTDVTAPYILPSNDTLNVISGTMETASGNNTAYTVSLSSATTASSTTSLNVSSGAEISYAGSNTSAASISSNRTDSNTTTANININGTLDSGTGLYAISLRNSNASAADTYNINVSTTGLISGNILSNNVLHSVVNLTGDANITGTISLSTLASGSSALIVGATGSATFTPVSPISDIGTLQVSNSSTFNLGVVNADIASVVIDANSSMYLTTTLEGLSTTDGAIVNNGSFYISADIAKTGGFSGSGTNYITGGGATPLTIDTSSYVVSNHTAVLQDVNTYGNITLSAANFVLSGANNFTIAYGTDDGYSPGYFPGGTYTLVTTTGGLVTAPNFTVPSDTMFLAFGTPSTTTDTITITLTRTPFNNYANTLLTQTIAGNLEIIGNNNPSNSMVTLLNAIEESTSTQVLQSALQQLAPLANAPVYGYQVQNESMRQAKLRLAELRASQKSYYAGDLGKDMHVWIRPFGAYGNQDAKDDSFGYYARTGGVIGGFDRDLDDYYTLGAACAYANSNIKDKINQVSNTNLKSYIAMIYGTYNYIDSTYLDWVMALTANNFDASRVMSFNSYSQVATASYSSQQFAINGFFGKDYEAFGFMQLTPEAFAQYMFTKQYPYTETGASGANLEISRQNSNIVSLGLGAKAAIPLLADPSVIVPEIHGMAFYNPLTGNQNTTFSFVDGGAPMLSTFYLSRTALSIGAAFSVAVLDNLEVKCNFDYEVADRFNGYTFWLNLRYIF